MSGEAPHPPPDATDDSLGDRSLSRGEQFLLWAGILLPGLTSPFFLIGWFLIAYTAPDHYAIWLIVLPIALLTLLLGSCYLCGWIHAVKQHTENRRLQALKTGGLFLLGQLIVTPTLGFVCFLLIAQVGGM